MSDVSAPSLIQQIAYSSIGAINSVVNIGGGNIALAVENLNKQDSGYVHILDTNGVFQTSVTVGALPDMITMTHDGQKLLVACEGEPDDDYIVDPEGSIAIIDISSGASTIQQSDVTILGFGAAPTSIPGSIQKPDVPWSQDLEPEYIAVSDDDMTAAVTCQEANVLVLIDLSTNTISSYKGLGYKDWKLPTNTLDVSDKDDTIQFNNWNILGIYMPDAIAAHTSPTGDTYWLTANEGDGRDYDGYSSEVRVKDLDLDTTIYTAGTQSDENLGRLKTLSADVIGDADADGRVEQIYAYGARSFSIWDQDGTLVWDSGDDIETYFADLYPQFFNCNDGLASKQDSRSDDKGPEPEAITTGLTSQGTALAFVGLERQGGVMIYDISDILDPQFISYISPFDLASDTSVDIAPEGLLYLPPSQNHTNNGLLIISNEVSGTVSLYTIDDITSIDLVKEGLLNIYPNPTDDIIHIALDQKILANMKIDLYDIMGRKIETVELSSENISLDLSSYISGVYLLQFHSVDGEHHFTIPVTKK